MVQEFVSMLTSLIGGFWTAIVDGMSELAKVFYVSGEGGGFTIFGLFGVIGLALFFILLVINWVRSLIGE